MTERTRVGFRRGLIEIGTAALIIGLLVVLLLPAVQQRRNSPRNPCRHNLKQIELALHVYHDTYGCFPPAITYGPDGRRWHSWRLLLVPYLESTEWFHRYRFDEPWNGPNNQKLADKLNGISVFHCPQDDNAPTNHTSYVAVIGEGTMWPPHGVARFDDIKDRTSPTLHVVEVSDSGVHWMEPVDLRLDAMSFSISPTKGVGIRSRHGGTSHVFAADELPGANAALVDGSVRFFDDQTPPEQIRSLLLGDNNRPAIP